MLDRALPGDSPGDLVAWRVAPLIAWRGQGWSPHDRKWRMKILMVGDIVGKPGRKMLRRVLPELKRELELDFVVVNGENAAAGTRSISGILSLRWTANGRCFVLRTTPRGRLAGASFGSGKSL